MRCATERGCARYTPHADRGRALRVVGAQAKHGFAIFVHFGRGSLSIERMKSRSGHRFADLRSYPPLVDNEAILMRNPINAIRMTLNGGFPPSTQGNPRPYGMPPFAHLMSDSDVAAVVTYIRAAWGNHASAVSPLEVAGARGVPVSDE